MVETNPSPPCDPVAESFPELEDFSLILGGPLYQLFRKANLDDVESRLRHRIFWVSGIAWLPLLVLCAIQGALLSGLDLPFLKDVETHARFLVAVPLLILAEFIVHKRIRGIVAQFVERGLIPGNAKERFRAAIATAMRWRNSIAAEVAILAVVFPLGYYLRTDVLSLNVSVWYATADPQGGHLSLPGYWMFWVSNPILQFLFMRWLFRLVIWIRFLWQVSRIELALIPTHSDRNGGLGFLSHSAHAYSPLLAGISTMYAGLVASKIFQEGAVLSAFKLEMVLLVAMSMALVLGPLTVFTPQILAAKRRGLREYGAFAANYSRQFDRRWLRSAEHDGEELLGTGDIQSLADLGNAFTVIKEMKSVPFGRDTFLQLAGATLAPFVPLVFTIIPFEELLDRIIRTVF